MTFVFIILITLVVALGATFIVLAALKRKKKINFPKPNVNTTRIFLNEVSELPQLKEKNESEEEKENVTELTEVEESVIPDADAGGDTSIDINTD